MYAARLAARAPSIPLPRPSARFQPRSPPRTRLIRGRRRGVSALCLRRFRRGRQKCVSQPEVRSDWFEELVNSFF